MLQVWNERFAISPDSRPTGFGKLSQFGTGQFANLYKTVKRWVLQERGSAAHDDTKAMRTALLALMALAAQLHH